MGGGKGAAKQANRQADQARADEQKRQADIRAGTQRINDIFNGTNVGSGALGLGAAFDPSATYYLANGQAWAPQAQQTTSTAARLTQSSASPRLELNEGNYDRAPSRAAQSGARAAQPGPTAEQQFQQMLAGGGLYSGVSNTGGFSDDYFAKQRQSYIDFATPQLEDQYGKAQRDLTFSLARSGNLDSSSRSAQFGELQKMYDINKQNIADQGRTYENQARSSVEDARAGLIAQLNATGDATGAANAALARSAALSTPQSFSPLGSLFADLTGGLAQQAQYERSAALGGTGGRYNTGLFSPRSNSVTVQR